MSLSSRQISENHLAGEKSPYLLQHAHNPVDWYPWGEEAFQKARDEHKPIFLSIGYSTCHWCHVMERESFEDPNVARVLNAHFVAIKVDREERPEVDDLYMTALTQALQQPGGWPMSMWLTPELRPFYGGTYFPPEDRWGRPGFKTILEHVSRLWTEKDQQIAGDAAEITAVLEQISVPSGRGELTPMLLDDAGASFDRFFDNRHGGFGNAPKFPQPSIGLFLLRHHLRTGSKRSLEMVVGQLESMARGGIYDHLGGGFARYSTDERWLVPHFEKMLYDNAQLLRLYAEAYQVTRDDRFAKVIRDCAGYVLREMTDPGGGFYSAEDADSEGVEGKFYVWRKSEVVKILGEEEAGLFCAAYDVDDAGNWQDPHHDTVGLNILNERLSREQLAKMEKLPLEEVERSLESSRLKLLGARQKRVRPLRDDKILSAWNGLMISGLTIAGGAIQERAYIDAAERAASFLRSCLIRDGRLLARYRQGEARFDGTLGDYACVVQGLLDLYAATLEWSWLTLANDLNEQCVARFFDDKEGGFYFTEEGRSDLLVRRKEIIDGALPSGNSVAVLNLVRLAEIRSDDSLREKAMRSLESSARFLQEYPQEMAYLLTAADYALGPSREVVIAGNRSSPVTVEMIRAVQTRFLPRTVLLLVSPDLDPAFAPVVKDKVALEGRPTAYVCENYTCRTPVRTAPDLVAALDRP
ncbi:MAG: thioredoxin domain-containing protein [Acidobacteria bacterium]|nr:thioredoxin domain-containing protein [Acidobacteriota bacterium]